MRNRELTVDSVFVCFVFVGGVLVLIKPQAGLELETVTLVSALV